MTLNIITTTEQDFHVECITEVFAINIHNQKENGLWLEVFFTDPKKPRQWIEYDPDYDIVNVIE